jgi:hypothetical protein
MQANILDYSELGWIFKDVMEELKSAENRETKQGF